MNMEDCKSTSGYVYMAGDRDITWSSKRQSLQVQSSTEAEYVVLLEAACEACWLWNLYPKLGLLDKNKPT